MSERRMFAKTIIDSDAFLDMPLTTQALYFHLSMRADDDGFVNNPKRIQRLVGCSEDDLKLLIAKSFIIPFESGIVVIKHWKVHNYIRSDRYKETDYKEEKSLLGIKENGEYAFRETLGIPTANQAVDELDTQYRLGKDSINNNIYTCDFSGEKSAQEVPQTEKKSPNPMPNYQTFVDLYHQLCPSLPKIQKLTETRKTNIKARWLEYPDIETFKKVFEKCENNAFMKGNNDRGWIANIDFIIQASSFTKIVEGYYDNMGIPKGQNSMQGKNSTQGSSFDTSDFYKAAMNRKAKQ